MGECVIANFLKIWLDSTGCERRVLLVSGRLKDLRWEEKGPQYETDDIGIFEKGTWQMF
jgi:hypothetical protein